LVYRFKRLPLARVLALLLYVRLDAEELGRYPARLPPRNESGFQNFLPWISRRFSASKDTLSRYRVSSSLCREA
jgi:hypothetical protein